MAEEKQRVSQYDQGVQDGADRALQILSMLVDFYPKKPSDGTRKMLAPEATWNAISANLQRFRERIAAEVRSGKNDKETEAAA